MKKIEIDIECQSCDGTGLYQGMGEDKGCAVVCTTCKGTGKYHYVLEYEPFTERKKRTDIKRVFGNTCGFKHGPDDYKAKDGTLFEFSKGGALYKDWLAGEEPKPLKDLYCPKLWTGQRWNSDKCNEHCRPGTSINYCPMKPQMDKCWEEFEETTDAE